jgi:hypothetical protein
VKKFFIGALKLRKKAFEIYRALKFKKENVGDRLSNDTGY